MILLGILLLLMITYRIVIRNANRRLMDIPFYSAHGMSHASVTVVIAARNEEDHIIRCLQSIMLQKHGFENLEIIVVDDGSTDSTWKILQEERAKISELNRRNIDRFMVECGLNEVADGNRQVSSNFASVIRISHTFPGVIVVDFGVK